MKPRRLNRTLVLGCAAGLVGAAVGVHLTRTDAPDPAPSVRQPARRTAAPATASSAGETGNDAEAVALRYVLSGQALLDAGPDGVDAVLAPIVAPAARRTLVADNQRQLLQVRGELSAATGPILWRQAPLAVLVEVSGDAATVAVWHVGVLTAPGAIPPQSHWATSTVELAHVDDGWKVTAETVVEGPAPLTAANNAPTDPAAFDDALAGFSSPDVA